MATAADEGRHRVGPERWWSETWSFEFFDGHGIGGYASLTLLPNQRRAWYWSALVRPDAPLVCLADLDVALPSSTFELRSDGLWAEHICESALDHWTIGNEAYGVALDDPAEALGLGLGIPTPLAFDLEWEADGPAVGDAGGYGVPALVFGEVLVGSDRLEIEAAGRWWHRWGISDWFEPSVFARPVGPRAPVLLVADGARAALEMVLTETGWVSWTQVL